MARSSNTAATYEAQFHDGRPQFVDITPAANVAAGEVYATAANNAAPVYVAHEAITANNKGAVARGGGIYICNTVTNVANNELVFWDHAESRVSNANNNGAAFGYVVPDGAVNANTTTYVIHQPFPLLG